MSTQSSIVENIYARYGQLYEKYGSYGQTVAAQYLDRVRKIDNEDFESWLMTIPDDIRKIFTIPDKALHRSPFLDVLELEGVYRNFCIKNGFDHTLRLPWERKNFLIAV